MGRTARPITPLTDEQRQLAEDNVNLIYSYVNRYKDKYPRLDHEDMLGICNDAYCRAIQNFDPNKGKLSTFAYLYMRGYLSMYVNRKAEYHVFLDDLVPGVPWEQVIDQPVIDSNTDKYEYGEARAVIDNLKQYGLDQREIDLLKWNYIYCDQPGRRHILADKMGITDKGVEWKLANIRKKLKPYKEDIQVAISG